MRIILASTSPRRKELMEKMGLPFEIKSSPYEEDMSIDKNPSELVKKLSFFKADALVNNHPNSIIIGADTIVVCDNKIMGKPKTNEKAEEMLSLLSNKVYSVFTGFTIINTKNDESVTKAVETKVHFRKISDKEIKDYTETKEPLDKAGAYAIQGGASKFVEKIEGSYNNIMGLPIEELKEELKQFIQFPVEKFPRVGVGVIIKRNNKVFFQRRKNSHGEGTWSFPGGHLEFNEKIEDCVVREVKEETGMSVKNIEFFTITNDIFEKENKHYITIFMKCEWDSGEPEIKEPDKCTAIDWFDPKEIPSPLFLPIENLLKSGYQLQ